jgi:hypothetical protein
MAVPVLEVFLAEGSLPQVFGGLDEVKAERFLPVRRAGFGWSHCPDDAVPQADRARVVAGALVQEELAWLRDESFDLDLIGFDATELERLLALADARRRVMGAEDDVPEPPEDPVTHPGDLLILGNHRLLCGDATVLADVERCSAASWRT